MDLVRRTFCDAGSLRGAPARDTVPAFDRAAAVAAALLLVFFTHPNRMLQLVPLLAAFAPGLAFVLLLYALPPARVRRLPRDAREHVLWRLVAAAAGCALAPLPLLLLLPARARLTALEALGAAPRCSARAATLLRPLGVLVTLFLGPLAAAALEAARAAAARVRDADSDAAAAAAVDVEQKGRGDGSVDAATAAAAAAAAAGAPPAAATLWHGVRLARAFLESVLERATYRGGGGGGGEDAALLEVRNLVVAPLSEELVFRACVLPLLVLSGAGAGAAVLLSCAAFALAHAHHYFARRADEGLSHEQALRSVLVQLSYTSLFGAIEAALFLQTGSLPGIVLPHAFCNFMGVPSLAWLHSGPAERSGVGAAFAVGIVGCAALLYFGAEAAAAGGAAPCALGRPGALLA